MTFESIDFDDEDAPPPASAAARSRPVPAPGGTDMRHLGGDRRRDRRDAGRAGTEDGTVSGEQQQDGDCNAGRASSGSDELSAAPEDRLSDEEWASYSSALAELRADPTDALREQLAAATARAEKAEARLAAIAASRKDAWTAALDRLRTDAMTADAAQDGLSATETDTDGVQASGDGNSSSITPQGLSEPEPERYPSAWCWAPNPAGRLHCGRLRNHEPPHQRGERTWTDDTTEER